MNFELTDFVEMSFLSPSDSSFWFGYYSKTPLSEDNKFLLAHKVEFDGRSISSQDSCEIGFFELETGKWNLIDVTKSFNWQQGALLQWIKDSSSKKIIYNVYEDLSFCSKIYDFDTHKILKISSPIYETIPYCYKALTLKFERSYWCRAYHYENIKDEYWNVDVHPEDGIFIVDLINNNSKKIISIEDIISIDFDATFEGSKHWLEHIMINPESDRFAFYHRFSTNYGFKTRVFTANIDGTDIYLVPNWRDFQWSHLGWRDNNNFVVFGTRRLAIGNAYQGIINRKGIFGKLLSKIYKVFISRFISKEVHNKLAEEKGYFLVQDKIGKIENYSHDKLIVDGHPSFSSDRIYMLTDSYADDKFFRNLMLYNTVSKKIVKLGRFYSPFNNVDYRCDLHPRFSTDNKYVIIDTAHNGFHQMMLLKLKWEKIHENTQ